MLSQTISLLPYDFFYFKITHYYLSWYHLIFIQVCILSELLFQSILKLNFPMSKMGVGGEENREKIL